MKPESRYFEAVRADLEALEGERKNFMLGFLAAAAAEIALALFAVTLLGGGDVPRGVLPVFGLAIGLTFAWYTYGFLRKMFGSTYKIQIMPKLVAAIDPGLKFHADGGIPQPAFVTAGLYPGAFSHYRGEDLVHGTYDGTPLSFSELNVGRVSGKSDVRIFKGLFFEVTLTPPIRGRVSVVPDMAGRTLAALGKTLEGRGGKPEGERVGFDDPEFEQLYEVYATDASLARQLLRPTLRKRLINIRHMAGREVSVAFVHDKLYLGVEMGDRDLFEPPLFHSLLDPGPFQAYVESLQFATGLVSEISKDARG